MGQVSAELAVAGDRRRPWQRPRGARRLRFSLGNKPGNKMDRDNTLPAPPPLSLLGSEGRGLLDIPKLLAAAPFLSAARRGKSQPVLVLPGLGADDRSTMIIRGFLDFLGYKVYGWGRGRNARTPDADLPAVAARTIRLGEEAGAKVSLVGWSRGGIIAREV